MSNRLQAFNSRHAAAIAAYAHRLRHAPTESELTLWRILAGNRLGVSFRRQYVVGRVIADFAAPSAKLIVEVDGGYHACRTAADSARDTKLRRLGWRVLRFPADAVRTDLDRVVAAIKAALRSGE